MPRSLLRQRGAISSRMPSGVREYTTVLLAAMMAVALASVVALLVVRRIGLLLLALTSRSIFISSESARSYLRSIRAQYNGRPEEAVRHAQELLDSGSRFNWLWLNCAINAMINAGRYKEALRLKARWSSDFLERAHRRHPDGYLLVHLNLVEALYNLGRFGCANQLLETITPECEERGSRLVRAGLGLQKAWLSVLMGDPAGALELLMTVNERHLPRSFRAEVHFTRAAALRDVGRLREAKIAAEAGATLSLRASSKRNALFVLGSIAAAEGQPKRAIEILEHGATHAYRAQGADGLVLLGEQYLQIGLNVESDWAYACAIARDPQGFAARRAGRRLRKKTAST
jgi:tetratricopeptide (TPR) repeat protein